MKSLILAAVAATVLGCSTEPGLQAAATASAAPAQPTCTYDLTSPTYATGTTCSAVMSPLFDVSADIPLVGHIATAFWRFNSAAVAGSRYDLADTSIVDLNGSPCTLGSLAVDALPPHWVIDIDAQCGSNPADVIVYGDAPGN